MNDPIMLSIIFGSGTLVGVVVTFAGNYFLKRLELKDREKERKFKVEEKMIERSIEAHMEALDQITKIFSLVNRIYAGDGTLVMSNEEEKELSEFFRKLNEWLRTKGFFLEKTIREQIGRVIDLGGRALGSPSQTHKPKMDILYQLWTTTHGLVDALETILKEYNPLYDLNIKLREFETSVD
ncbi:MAG: hypothetical protein WCE90_11645 [Candidatus Zixiibacteriota bacterium]